MHEIYRVGARPFVGGTAGELKAPDLPGGQCPDHRLLGQPHLIEPFGARMRKASQAAIDVMRGKIPEAGTLPSVPDTPPPLQEMVRHLIRREPPIRQHLQPCSSGKLNSQKI